ncbi:MAG: hypothetical protein IKZ91_00640 [Bacteroidales bacterium]|nr:hypothetical protein [Bacteroidales bacterium]
MKRIVLFATAAALLLAVSCGKEDNDPQGQDPGSFKFSAVDLGLSVKWANANLGANVPEEFGDYFAWGETDGTGKELYDWTTYKWCNNNGFTFKFTKYNTDASNGSVDNKMTLDPEDDAAHVKLGGNWRMPTTCEVEELVSTRKNANYTWEWKEINGIIGWLVTYRVNKNSIFLPAAGGWSGVVHGNVGTNCYYWSSSLSTEYSEKACLLYSNSENVEKKEGLRCAARSIRPVMK